MAEKTQHKRKTFNTAGNGRNLKISVLKHYVMNKVSNLFVKMPRLTEEESYEAVEMELQ